MAVRFQLRRDTAANWTATNPVLALGEPGVETDTLKVKVGDGTTAWNSLAYSITKDFNDLTSKPTTVAGYGIVDALTLTALSVTQNAASGTGALTYNNTTGVFEYTPPDFEGLDGNFVGSVFADDSTIMVDGVSATLNFVNNDTDDLAEGSTNKYFSTTLVDNHLTGGTGVTYSSGSISIGQAVGTGDNVEFNKVTTSTIDSADSSAITVETDVILNAGLTVGNHILPSSNENVDLGSASNRFRDIYLSGSTINLGGAVITRGAGNTIELPVGTTLGGVKAPNQTLDTTDDAAFNSVTGNVFTSLIDSTDSSAITITPDVVMSAGLTVGNHILPSSSLNIDLGSESFRFRDLYLSGTSAIIGDLALKRHTSGGLLVSDHSTGDPTNITTHNIVANDITAAGTITGDVTGNLTGNVTGDVAGTVTGNIFTSLIDSVDSSAIVFTPAVVMNSDLTVENRLTAADVRTTGSVQIDGDLVVSGTTVTIDATNLAVQDNMIYLNSGSAVSNPDLGFAGNYNDGTYAHAGLFRDATDGVWKLFDGYVPEPDESAYIDTSHGSFSLAPVAVSQMGIGAEPDSGVELYILDPADGGASWNTTIQLGRRAGTSDLAYIQTHHDGSDGVDGLNFKFNTADVLTILDGKIGIGYNAPADNIHVLGSSGTPNVGITLQSHDTANATAALSLYARDSSNVNKVSEIKNVAGQLFIERSDAGTDVLALKSTAAGAGGPQLDFYHHSASPADNDVIGTINFNGWDDGSNATTYARISGIAVDVTNGAEKGDFIISTRTNASTFSEKIRVTNAGNFIVGKNTTAIEDVGTSILSTGRIISTADSDDVLVLRRNTTDGTIISFRRDGTTVGSIGVESSDNFSISATTGGGAGLLLWGAGGTSPVISPMKEGVVTDDAVQLGRTSERFTNLFLSGGVYLGGTGSANLLDDYEEGTFDSISITGGGGPSISSQFGSYVKVGSLVTLSFRLNISRGTATGIQGILNLPFAATNANANYMAVAQGHWAGMSTSLYSIYFTLGNNSTTGLLYATDAAATTPRRLEGTDWPVSPDAINVFTITYHTDS